MGTSTFRKGASIVLNGKPATLLKRIDGDIWQVEEKETERIREVAKGELHALYEKGDLTFAPAISRAGTAKGSQPRIPATEAQWEVAKVRRMYVKAIISLPHNPALIEQAIDRVWVELTKRKSASSDIRVTPPSTVAVPKPSCITAYRWKRRYIDAGNDLASLLDNLSACGNRKPRYPQEVVDIARDSIEVVYLTRERNTIQQTVDRAQALVVRENHQRPRGAQLPLPSWRLVKGLIGAMPAYDLCVARYGREIAAHRFRSVKAHRTTHAPLERAEIDHTQLDLMVLDDATNLPLGRPYVTACVDDYTRCVLGIFISFEPPSYFTVARCLRHAFLPKTRLNAEYPGLANEWEAHGVMRELVVDNGLEFHSTSLDTACAKLDVEIHYSARKTPWFKGKIERFFRTLNEDVSHGKPGTTFGNIFDRGDYDPAKHAVIRYSVLKEVVYRWIVDVYHQKPHSGIGDVSPAAYWRQTIAPDDIPVANDPKDLDFILGGSTTRSLSHKGVLIDGLLYNSQELTKLRYSLGDRMTVEVVSDAADLGHVLVHAPGRPEVFKVPALRQDYATGLSSWQHRVCKRYAADNLARGDVSSWLEAKERIRELVAKEMGRVSLKTRARIARFNESNVLIPEHGSHSDMNSPVHGSITSLATVSKRLLAPEQLTTTATAGDVLAEAPPIEERPTSAKKRFAPVYRDRS